MRGGLIVCLALLAGLGSAAVAAQEIQTACANLPEQGIIGSRQGPDIRVPPRRENGRWACQAGFRLQGNPPVCIGASMVPVNGNPRALCYANLPFTLERAGFPATLSRPIADQCPAPARADIVVRGNNIGFTDVGIAVLAADGSGPAQGVRVVARRASGPQVPTHIDPVLSHCHAYACVRLGLEFAANAPDLASIRFTLPGGRKLDYQIATAPKCPPPPQPACRRRPGASLGQGSLTCIPS